MVTAYHTSLGLWIHKFILRLYVLSNKESLERGNAENWRERKSRNWQMHHNPYYITLTAVLESLTALSEYLDCVCHFWRYYGWGWGALALCVPSSSTFDNYKKLFIKCMYLTTRLYKHLCSLAIAVYAYILFATCSWLASGTKIASLSLLPHMQGYQGFRLSLLGLAVLRTDKLNSNHQGFSCDYWDSSPGQS